MKKIIIGIIIFIITSIAISLGIYGYKVLSDVEETQWDINGNEIYSWNGKGSNKQYHYYDENNRLIEYKSVMKGVMPESVHIYYDYDGDKRSGVRYVYDEHPERNHETKYIHVNKNCVQHVDSLEGTSTYEYDDNSKLIKLTKADGSFTKYTYDENGKKILEEDSDGKIETYEYNSQNLLVKKTIGENVYIYEYDSQGRLVKEIDGNSIYIYEYDVDPKYGEIKRTLYLYDGEKTFLTYVQDENDVLVEFGSSTMTTVYRKITKYKYWENGNKKSKKTYTLGQYGKKNIDSTK